MPNWRHLDYLEQLDEDAARLFAVTGMTHEQYIAALGRSVAAQISDVQKMCRWSGIPWPESRGELIAEP